MYSLAGDLRVGSKNKYLHFALCQHIFSLKQLRIEFRFSEKATTPSGPKASQ